MFAGKRGVSSLTTQDLEEGMNGSKERKRERSSKVKVPRPFPLPFHWISSILYYFKYLSLLAFAVGAATVEPDKFSM